MMQWTQCRACGHQISAAAQMCPQCGHPTFVAHSFVSTPPQPKKKEGSFLLALMIVGLPVLGFMLYVYNANSGVRPGGTFDPAAVIRQPETLVSQTVVLQEGNARAYGFTLPGDRRIDVAVTASPRTVNVMLMREDQWQQYTRVRGSLFGGQFQYVQALSSRNVTQFRDSAPLPAGAWRIVVERPSEAVFFGDSTSASVSIISN